MKGLEITKELSDIATWEDYSQVIQVVTKFQIVNLSHYQV